MKEILAKGLAVVALAGWVGSVQATVIYDVFTQIDVTLQSVTRLTSNGTDLLEISADGSVLVQAESSTGTGFASATGAVIPEVPVFDAIPIGVGQGISTTSMASGGASQPGGSATSFVDVYGNISAFNRTSDTFVLEFLVAWIYSIETIPMDPGEFASAGFDVQLNQGGSMGASNVFFEGFGFDFFNTHDNPGLFSDSDSFVYSYVLPANERLALSSFSFATGEALASPRLIPEPSVLLLLATGLLGLSRLRRMKPGRCSWATKTARSRRTVPQLKSEN